ncbi:hypothetical protein [Actinomadura monticuli]|uniref:Uncharacterized protein n=1 Tax=Actinomadura monticuli TaxID=3097367 RepID=A0ABV4QDI7_9ACTN
MDEYENRLHRIVDIEGGIVRGYLVEGCVFGGFNEHIACFQIIEWREAASPVKIA